MRANRLKFLAPLLLIASLAVAISALFALGVSHADGSLAICPAGTNWDHVTGICH
jgi:hypothetical protein